VSGSDAIKGFSYQCAYTLYRLLDLLSGEDGGRTSLVAEGTGPDVEDLTLRFPDGTEEVIQIKKRETRQGAYGQWGWSEISPIVRSLYQLIELDRDITRFRFVATGSAQSRIVSVQKACQKLREGQPSGDADERAVEAVMAATGATKSAARRFMRRLWLDIPFDDESSLRARVQNRLIKAASVPAEVVDRVYNDLTARILEKGKPLEPEARRISREDLLSWLESPADPRLKSSLGPRVVQRVKALRGSLTGAEVQNLDHRGLEIEQRVETVEAGGKAVGLREGSEPDGGEA